MRPWCEHCVSGKGIEAQHRIVDPETSAERVIQIDYGFYGSDATICAEREAVRKILVAVDVDTGMPYQLMCRSKGPSDKYAAAGLTRFIVNLRVADLVVQSDGESPTKAMAISLCKVLRKRHGVPTSIA